MANPEIDPLTNIHPSSYSLVHALVGLADLQKPQLLAATRLFANDLGEALGKHMLDASAEALRQDMAATAGLETAAEQPDPRATYESRVDLIDARSYVVGAMAASSAVQQGILTSITADSPESPIQ